MLQCTLRQLQVFEKVALRLSFSRAAEEMYMSQPAVSMQIKQLEENVGLALFEQIGKKIFLTEAGRELLQCVADIHHQLTQVELKLEEMKGLDRGNIRLAVVNSANYFVPKLLAWFCQSHPNINVSLQVANRQTVLRLLAENSVDLAIIGAPPSDLDLQMDFFMDNPLIVVAPPDHPLAGAKNISGKRLANECFISREAGSGTRKAMTQYFCDVGIEPHIGLEMDTNESIKQAVQAGMGLSILSQHSIELELEAGRLVVLDVNEFPLMRRWHISHLSNKKLSKAADAFKKYLLDGHKQD